MLRLLACLALACASPLLHARTLYVDNVNGSDRYDGLQSTAAGGQSGPFQSIQQAFNKAQVSDRIEVANTGVPYRGGNVLRRVGGTAEKPMVIEGNGAVISGLGAVPAEKWEPVQERVVKTEFWPMSNQLKGNRNFPYWIGTPQIWWVDGVAAVNCLSKEELMATPGGFFWNKAERAVWFHLPQGKELAELEVLLPVHGTGLNVNGAADYVVVQNFKSMYSWNDGFSAHGSLKSLTFRNCISVDNCGQGFSMHGYTRVLVEDSYAARNASSGACDVNHCQVTYRRSVLINNSFETGVYATEETQTYYEDCLIVGNAPFEQVWQVGHSRMVFVNSIIAGAPGSDKPLLRLSDGNLTFIQSTLLNGSKLVAHSRKGNGALVLDHTVVAGFTQPLFTQAELPRQLVISHSVFDQSLTLIAQGNAALADEVAAAFNAARQMELRFEGELGVQLAAEPDLSAAGERYRRPARIGARLPQSVWALYQAGKAHAPQRTASAGL